MVVRRPWVAGAFYPAQPESLKNALESCFRHRLGPKKLPKDSKDSKETISIISPHAGYMYSGPVAAHGYFKLSEEKNPETVIILGPNHTGMGSPVSLWGSGAWETPLGRVEVDSKLATMIFRTSDVIDIDERAHIREHSIEVQLPFLQYIYDEFKVVPICMGFQDLKTSREVGNIIADNTEDINVLIIASTDLTHMEPQPSAEVKDGKVIDSILAMDEKKVIEVVGKEKVSMCGYGPVVASIVASKRLGAKSAELLSYQTSGDITKDYTSVVGYASIRISR